MPLFADVENKNVEIPEWLDHPYGPDEVKVSITLIQSFLATNFYVYVYLFTPYVEI